VRRGAAAIVLLVAVALFAMAASSARASETGPPALRVLVHGS
jgi:hypothetical protein